MYGVNQQPMSSSQQKGIRLIIFFLTHMTQIQIDKGATSTAIG